MLQINDITKTYGTFRALDGVSLHVRRGTVFGLLGPNGAGKTTLIRIINHIIAPDSGTLLFDGHTMTDNDVMQIGYLPEERGLYKKMRVGEQAIYLARLKGLDKATAQQRLNQWFSRLDIGDWWNRPVEELSKGMQQKVQFVVTMLHNPQLLILDEPFSGFDPVNADMLKREILRLKEEGTTIIFSTHNMPSAEELCDDIALINHARVVLSGSLADIKANNPGKGLDRIFIDTVKLLAGVYAIPIILASRPLEHANVLVVDDSGLFQGQFRSGRDITYHEAGSIDYARRQLEQTDTLDAIVYIPARETTLPRDAYLYYRTDAPSMTVQGDVNSQLQEILRNRILLDVHGLTPDDYTMLTSTHIKLRTQDIETGRDSFLQVKIALGIILAMLVFIAVFMFGSQVMRGVMEEKTSRIVEVIVCSVKPFQLMMGKVVGIGLVGLTQFALWVILSAIAVTGVQLTHADLFEQVAQRNSRTEIASKGSEATTQYQAAQYQAEQYQAGEGIDNSLQDLIQGLTDINYGLIILLFIFYFVFGYLLYASLFAAAGSLVDNDTDSQQFTLPLTVPLLLAMLLLPAMINEPSGNISTWLSLIPFTSPVAMLLRIPFGVPVWQVVLSMLLLLATFPLCIWAAAKIYRSAILRYGQKTTWRDVWHLIKR